MVKMLSQKEYQIILKNIKQHDIMPFDDILFLEKTFNDLKESITVEQFYQKVSNNIDRKTFDAIINYLLKTSRLRIDKKSGYLFTAWDPVGVEKALQDGSTIF